MKFGGFGVLGKTVAPAEGRLWSGRKGRVQALHIGPTQGLSRRDAWTAVKGMFAFNPGAGADLLRKTLWVEQQAGVWGVW